jgi:hypothetical protein
MRSWKSAAWIALAVSTPLLAQFQDNSEKQLTCQNGGYDSDRVRYCEMREQSVASIGQLNIDAGRNGGTNVKGWTRGDVLVRARVEAWADTQGAAASMAGQVFVDSSGGQVHATGPEGVNNSGWSVSYEIFVPQNSSVTAKTHNGGISISDVLGQIRFEATNGGINLKRVAGDISGSTVNGGVNVVLAGTGFEGRQMDITTRNGGVTVAMPETYSAHVQAETNNGGIHSDFPVNMTGPLNLDAHTRPRKLDFQVGAGGPLIHITTSNGGVTLKRAM